MIGTLPTKAPSISTQSSHGVDAHRHQFTAAASNGLEGFEAICMAGVGAPWLTDVTEGCTQAGLFSVWSASVKTCPP